MTIFQCPVHGLLAGPDSAHNCTPVVQQFDNRNDMQRPIPQAIRHTDHKQHYAHTATIHITANQYTRATHDPRNYAYRATRYTTRHAITHDHATLEPFQRNVPGFSCEPGPRFNDTLTQLNGKVYIQLPHTIRATMPTAQHAIRYTMQRRMTMIHTGLSQWTLTGVLSGPGPRFNDAQTLMNG